MQNTARLGPGRAAQKKGALPLPASALYPFAIANLHQEDRCATIEPAHGDCVAVGEYPRLGVHVPKLVSHFCVPLSFLSVYSIA